jgi:hypothetical protein
MSVFKVVMFLLIGGASALNHPCYIADAGFQAFLAGDTETSFSMIKKQNGLYLSGSGKNCNKQQAMTNILDPVFKKLCAVYNISTSWTCEDGSKIVTPSPLPKDPTSMVKTALQKNTFFDQVVSTQFYPSVFLFKPLAIQVYTDDMSQYEKMSTWLVSDFFNEYSNTGVHVSNSIM